MNWLILILAGCMEVAFTFCLGKTKETSGTEELMWWVFFFHEPATFWRIFFITTLIISIVGLKIVG